MTDPEPTLPTKPQITIRPISRVSALHAAADGGDGFRAGLLLARCPYPANGPLEDRFRRHFWIRGWSAAAEVQTLPEN
jgi:hypothetical protein